MSKSDRKIWRTCSKRAPKCVRAMRESKALSANAAAFIDAEPTTQRLFVPGGAFGQRRVAFPVLSDWTVLCIRYAISGTDAGYAARVVVRTGYEVAGTDTRYASRLADCTENFSGAELAGLVRSAARYAATLSSTLSATLSTK
eukprot:1739095-Rhodomonas_salina.1